MTNGDMGIIVNRVGYYIETFSKLGAPRSKNVGYFDYRVEDGLIMDGFGSGEADREILVVNVASRVTKFEGNRCTLKLLGYNGFTNTFTLEANEDLTFWKGSFKTGTGITGLAEGNLTDLRNNIRISNRSMTNSVR